VVIMGAISFFMIFKKHPKDKAEEKQEPPAFP
jgi:hypothetical protein